MDLAGHHPGVWLGFTAVVMLVLVIDLGFLNRRSHVIATREAAIWSGCLVLMAAIFAGWLWNREGRNSALEFTTGYLIELSLSVDNLFVFILIFQYFNVPARLQPKVLNWGILGALVMRGIMIAFGAILLARFHWIIYVFGAILVYTGARMFRGGEAHRVEPEHNPLVRAATRILPFSRSYHGDKFFYVTRTRWLATPLLLVLLVVEWTDLVFAIDSIPAIFSVTRDPFIVYSSNVFAIIGLRALYFLLAGMLDRFHYLQAGVALILTFVGLKMVVSGLIHVPTELSLFVIVGVLATAIGASMVRNRRAAPVMSQSDQEQGSGTQ